MNIVYLITKDGEVLHTGDDMLEGLIMQSLRGALGNTTNIDEYLKMTHLIIDCYLKVEGDFSLFDFIDFIAYNYDEVKDLKPFKILLKYHNEYTGDYGYGEQ